MRAYKFRYFSKNRALRRRFFLIFLMGFLCLTAAIGVQVQLWNNRLETARNQYGLWQGVRFDINQKDKELLLQHELLETVGTEKIYGLFETDGRMYITGSGTFDFYQLANFHILQGGLPENGEEILVESRVLDQLGMAYETGQILEGSIQGKTKRFTIAGIVDNYSASWMRGDSQPAVFLGEGTDLQTERENVFIRAESPYVLDNLKVTMPLLVRNVHIQEVWEPFSQENMVWTVLMLLSTAGSVLILCVHFRKWLYCHRQDIQVLKGIGVSDRKISKDLIHMIIMTSGLAMLISGCLGIILDWPITVLLSAIIIMMLEEVIVCSLLILEVHQIPAVENAGEKEMPAYYRYRTMTRITDSALSFRFLSSKRKSIAASILIGVVLFGALFLSILSLTETWQYQAWLKEKPDFILSLDPEGMETFRTDNTLEHMQERLENDERFCDIRTGFVQMHGWTIPVRENSLLEKIRNDPFISEETKSTILNPATLSLEDRQMVPMISRDEINLSAVEGLDEEVWSTGNGIILCVPEMTIQDGDLWLAEDVENPKDVMREEGYRPGESITILDPMGNEIETRIAGLLREAPENMRYDYLLGTARAYTMFVSPKFFEYPINRMHLTLGDNTDGAAAEVSLSTMAEEADVYLTNERAPKQKVRDFLYNEETLYGFLSLILLAASVFSGYSMKRRVIAQLDHYTDHLKLAGMRNTERIRRCVFTVLILVLLTGVLLAGVLVIQIHSRFPTSPDLLYSAMPFLFVSGDPKGIRELDWHIGSWLLPVMMIVMLAMMIPGKIKSRILRVKYF